ncbi:MAG: 30S ribosomal protein S20 [Patescibacteria group bacterium]|nr:30S ribosomal protein S20 [Patescibacteria group bacterium]MCX7589645.1 30S ribosomal protein S20 [Patescibacteria group bacterium]MDW8279627.1 30S ribosomal protein S20 [bacterium]
MPITKSAKKALRQNIKRKKRNLAKKEAYKKAIKDYKKLLIAKNFNEAKQKLSLVFKSLDKAAKTNVIHKNKASRLKSRLSILLKKAEKLEK